MEISYVYKKVLINLLSNAEDALKDLTAAKIVFILEETEHDEKK